MFKEGGMFETHIAKLHNFCFVVDLINQFFQVALITRYHSVNVRIKQQFLIYIKMDKLSKALFETILAYFYCVFFMVTFF